MSTTVLVIGGTGNTGGRVARRLRDHGHVARIASRGAGPSSPADQVRFDWKDGGTYDAPLAGVEAVYLVAPAHVPDPAAIMIRFVDHSIARGVRRFVLLGSSALDERSPGLGHVDAHLRRVAPEWTVLRPSWFMQNFLNPTHGHGISLRRDGELVTSTGDGKVGFVDAEDIAEVAFRALTDPRAHDAAHLITGPEALSYDDVARIFSEVTGRTVRHRRVSDSEARARLVAGGMPESYAAFLVHFDEAIRGGSEDRVSPAVLEVTGHAPRSLAAFAREHRVELTAPGTR